MNQFVYLKVDRKRGYDGSSEYSAFGDYVVQLCKHVSVCLCVCMYAQSGDIDAFTCCVSEVNIGYLAMMNMQMAFPVATATTCFELIYTCFHF